LNTLGLHCQTKCEFWGTILNYWLHAEKRLRFRWVWLQFY